MAAVSVSMPRGEGQRLGRGERRSVVAVMVGPMLAMLAGALDQTAVATSLSAIDADLSGSGHIAWMVTAYLLAGTIATPLHGKLGDRFGRVRCLHAAIVIFSIGAVGSFAAQTLGQLVGARALQGAGAAGLMVGSQALIASVVTPRERARFQGLFGIVFAVASLGGPLLGGALTDAWSWRAVVVIGVPLALASAWATATLSAPAASVSRRQATGGSGRAPLDYWGAVALAGVTGAVVMFSTWGGTRFGWSSAPILGLGAGAIATGWWFVSTQRRAQDPLLPLRIMRSRTVAVSCGVSLLVGVALFGVLSVLPRVVLASGGGSAANAGMVLIPMMLSMLVASTVVGRITAATGRYRIFPIVGTLIAAVGLWAVSSVEIAPGSTPLLVSVAVVGVGLGCCSQTLVLAVQNDVDRADLGVGTSTVSFARSMGGVLGVAVFGALLDVLDADLVASGALVFRCAAPIMLVGCVLAMALRETPLNDGPIDHP